MSPILENSPTPKPPFIFAQSFTDMYRVATIKTKSPDRHPKLRLQGVTLPSCFDSQTVKNCSFLGVFVPLFGGSFVISPTHTHSAL